MSEESKEQEVTEETAAETTEAAPEAAEAAAEVAPEAAPAEEAKSGESEASLDSLGLSKPLDKMTAKELRELVIEKVPQITGASGMSKDELVSAIKEVFGIVEEEGAVSPYKKQISKLKGEMSGLRAQRKEAGSSKEREILRKKINKLKKRTRRLAKAV